MDGAGGLSGRGDLWLGLHWSRKSGAQYCYTIEAKQSVTGRSPEEIRAEIDRKLGMAKMQLRLLHHEFRYGYPMAICYHIPSILTKTAIVHWKTSNIFGSSWNRVGDLGSILAIAARSEPRQHAGQDLRPGVLSSRSSEARR